MSSPVITFDTSDLNKIEKQYEKAIQKIDALTMETINSLGDSVLVAGSIRTFESQGERGAQGKWQMLADYTVRKRLEGRGGTYGSKKKYGGKTISKQQIWAERRKMKILQDTNALSQSVSILTLSPHEVVVGSRLHYASKHQHGDKKNTLNGRPAPIPQRKFLFITKNDMEKIDNGIKIGVLERLL